MKREQNKCYNYTYNAYLHFSQEIINKFEQSPSFLSFLKDTEKRQKIVLLTLRLDFYLDCAI